MNIVVRNDTRKEQARPFTLRVRLRGFPVGRTIPSLRGTRIRADRPGISEGVNRRTAETSWFEWIIAACAKRS